MQCSRNRIASISKRLRCCAGLVHSKCLHMRQPLRRSQGVLCCTTADTVPVIILVVLWMFVIADAVAAQAFIGHAQHNGNHSWGSLRKLSMPARKRCTQRRVSSHIAGHGCLLYHKLLMSVKAQLFGDYAFMVVKDKDSLFDMQHQRIMPCRCAPVLSLLQREMLSTRLVLVYPQSRVGMQSYILQHATSAFVLQQKQEHVNQSRDEPRQCQHPGMWGRRHCLGRHQEAERHGSLGLDVAAL